MECKEKFCIVIPVYSVELSPIDKIGLEKLYKVLGYKKYPTKFVCPKGLDLTNYRKIYPNFDIEEFDTKWFKGIYEYSQLCLQYEFYDRFSNYEYMFMYQLDSYIWEDRIEEICNMGYDYIGGPVFSGLSKWDLINKDTGKYEPKVGNGGCGWRKIETFKDICNPEGEFRKTYNITDEILANVVIEDKYFSNDIERKYDLYKPSYQKALSIVWDMSVPEIYDKWGYKKLPMCAHALYKYPTFWKDKVEEFNNDEIQKYCIDKIKKHLISSKQLHDKHQNMIKNK